jgi:hypothetical protein
MIKQTIFMWQEFLQKITKKLFLKAIFCFMSLLNQKQTFQINNRQNTQRPNRNYRIMYNEI